MPIAMKPAERPIALVTGAGRRIGRAIALGLAKGGWDLALHYRTSATEAEAVAREARGLGARAITLAADLAHMADVAALVPNCREQLGPVSCLINNASEFLIDEALTCSEASWDLHLDVNLKAPVFLAQAMARGLSPEMRGSIINIIDQRVWNLTPEYFSYTIAKAGLWTATQTMAQALAPQVRVNAIGPGPVLRSVHQADGEFEAECRSTLMQRSASPEEIAATVLFILNAPSLTGQMIAIDGGQHLARQGLGKM